MSASKNTVRVSASPKQVRAWAEAEGLIGKGQRGRLGAPVIKAYNAKHGVKHTEKAFAATLKVTAKPEKGRSVTRTVEVKAVREWAKENGLISDKHRGPLAKSVLSAYVLR
jgi:hypothetical protein